MEKRSLKNLFIAGGAVIFVNMVLPMLDSLTNMVISAVNKTVNQRQLDMELDRREAEAAAEVIAPSPSVSHAIGFSVPDDNTEYDYEGKNK